MAKYNSKLITDKKIWESFLLKNNPKSFLQSWNWGEVNERLGEKIFRLGFYQESKLVGICLTLKENAKRGLHLIVPAGPVMDWENASLTKFFIKTIRDLAIEENCWFIRVRPEILDNDSNRDLFRNLGFVSSPMHLHAENTWVLDITKSEEEILKGMRKSTRYLVKKSEGLNLDVQISKDKSLANILFKLQKETAIRHKFVGFSKELFESEIDVFTKDNMARVFLCKKSKKNLAIAIIIFYGDTAYYHFSASTSDYSHLPFSYLLQWRIIKEAKKRGIKYYNFWGISSNTSPKHRFAGVTLFKTGFGGERVDWLHAHDLPVSCFYWLTYVFEHIRKVLRRL